MGPSESLGLSYPSIQMCARGDARAICEGLREEVVTLASLGDALTRMPRSSKGRAVVARLLREARDEPWSTLELDAHRLLREARITGWRTNAPVLIDGRTYKGDVLFHKERLIVELDGRRFHTHAELDDNNERRNALVGAGWRVMNFSGATLDGMVPTIERFLRTARAAWKRDKLPLLPLARAPENADGNDEWHVA